MRKEYLFLFIIFSLSFQSFPSDFYLTQGKQTKISATSFKKEIFELKKGSDLGTLKNVLKWKRKTFKGKSVKGKLIGKRNVESIYNSKLITGCHDDALIVASVLRELKIPTIVVDTTGITWSKGYLSKKQGLENAAGHVFLEVLLGEKWHLLDSTYEKLIMNYNPNNLVIPISHQGQKDGYYIMTKSKDSWDSGIRSLDDLLKMQVEFASRAVKSIKVPNYKIINLF